MGYITGDKHAEFDNVINFCVKNRTTKDDIMIIIGDAGINYYANELDLSLKNKLKETSITFFCIHGNHEERPENIESYKTKIFLNGLVYYEEDFPNILFAKDGEIYDINNKKVLVIGGAYSIDKYYRLAYGYNWYDSEQPSEETKKKVFDLINKIKKVDIVLTHTCPYKYIPREIFLSGVDQFKVDNSTEEFLDKVEELLEYNKWYCGHYHTDKIVDKIRFMFNDIIEFN